MTSVQINGQSVRLSPSQVIGKGGEADIYQLDPTTVLKLYKRPDDPDYARNMAAQAGAKLRLDEHQRKLPDFPSQLPPEVVAPQELATRARKVAGYTMPYIDGMDTLMNFSNRAFRESSGVDGNQVIGVFRELRRVVELIHRAGVVIGDFNDLNVLTDNTSVRLVDADSMQFGGYQCRTYTSRFIDPLLADKTLELYQPHAELSDWYAYFVMLMQSLLYVGPYGGVHRPKTGRRLHHDARVLARITVLDPEVVYPKPALAVEVLPDDWQAYIAAVTKQDKREIFPRSLIESIRFATCSQCGATHARPSCPQCQKPGVVRQKLTIRGTVKAHVVFKTSGRILQAAMQSGQLRYLYEESGDLRRDGDRRLVSANLSSELRYRLLGDKTLIGRGSALLCVSPDGSSTRVNVEQYHAKLPMFDSNNSSMFWLQNSQLMQSAERGPRVLGSILSGQTLFWAEERLGFGFYQAGSLTRGFVFVPGRSGINDNIELDGLTGQLVDATCVLSDTLAWFFAATQENGSLIHRLQVIDLKGNVIGRLFAEAGEDSWLGRGIRGHVAIGSSLFVASDDGLARIGTTDGAVVVEREFPDTEPFMNAHCWLMPGPGGIHVVSTREITLLTI